MTPRPEDHFPPDYRRAREAFLAAAEARGARLAGRALADRGPGGEELAIDVALLGPEEPSRLLAVSSGIHGVEGFAGSAVQQRLLTQQWEALDLPADTGLLLVHALNPYGFAALRRVNESNVDLNRNFLRHPEEHAPNPGYDALYEAINPERLDPESERVHLAALLEYGRTHGARALQEALTRGQYAHPEGVQFGGAREEAGNRALRDVVARVARAARHVVWIDVHTGLGPFGEVELITECPPDHPAYARGRAWFGERTRSTRSGESVSAALQGFMERGLEESLPAGCALSAYAAEFGTYDPNRVFLAMRADNWLERHGDPASPQGRAIKAELLEVFRPADPHWQARVLETAADLVERAARGLAASGRGRAAGAPRAAGPARPRGRR